MTSGTKERVELREALELMVRELKAYACKHGLGPAKLQYALSQGEAALAAVEREGARGVTGDEIRKLFVFNDPCRNDCNVGATITAIVTWLNRRTVQSPVAPAPTEEQ